MEYYGDYGDIYSIEHDVDYSIDGEQDVSHSTPGISMFDRIDEISVGVLLRVIFAVHLCIIFLILAGYYENKSSIHSSLTRFQLLVVILSGWLLLYGLC